MQGTMRLRDEELTKLLISGGKVLQLNYLQNTAFKKNSKNKSYGTPFFEN
jgi:hypothetical protein